MSSVPPGTDLGRDDVIGRMLVEIVQSEHINENGLDLVYSFFRLDSGATVFLPFDDAGRFLTEEPPADAATLDHVLAKPVLGQRIADVVRQGPDADFYHDAPYLIMDNGYVVTNVLSDYHGTGYAGLHVYMPGEIDVSQMADFFSK